MNELEIKATMTKVAEGVKKVGKVGGATVLALLVAYNSIGYNDSGVSTRLQQPIVGHKWIKEEGWYFKMPFVSRTRSYNQKGTIAASDDDSIVNTASLVAPPRALQFADSYEMIVEWSLRYEIPASDEMLEDMHKSLKSESNLLGNTLMPFAQTLVNDSVNQMLGGDFAQGGRNSLRTLIDDQSQNGMYQTKVDRVRAGREDGVGTNSVTGGTTADGIEITKVTYLKDSNGKKLRTDLAISQYGIKVVPNSIAIIETQPLGRLVQYIENKQTNIAKQIAQDEQQKLLTKEAQTAKLQGEKELIDKTNTLNIQKQTALIAASQRVEEAKLQAQKEAIERQKVSDLAVIDKNRELEVAKANEAIETVEKQKIANLAIIDKQRELQIAQADEGIQKANYAASKYEAQAIKEKGFAQAAVDTAMLKAKMDNKEIYLAELNRDVQIKTAEVLPKVNLTMPQYIMNGSGTGGNVSDLLNVKLVQDVVKSNK